MYGKRFCSILLVILLTFLSAVNNTGFVQAKTSSILYDKEGLLVTFIVNSEWDSGFEGQIVLKNNSETDLENWSFQMNFKHEILNIWDAEIVSHTANAYQIKSPKWNTEIKVGSSAIIGFTGKKTSDISIPTEFKYLSEFLQADEKDYIITYSVQSDWKDAFHAQISIKNNSVESIVGWSLEFKYDSKINNIWNAKMIEQKNNYYLIKNDDWNSEIKPGQAIHIGFEAVPGSNGSDKEPYDYKLTKLGQNGSASDSKVDIYSDFETDTDGDGISDFEELFAGTDANKKETTPGIPDGELDSDGNGIKNIDEMKHGSSPGIEDPDNDGISDYDEIYKYHTLPNKVDSDDDGLSDPFEISIQYDPMNTDSNGDGIPDGEDILTSRLMISDDDDLDEEELGYKPIVQMTGKGDYNLSMSVRTIYNEYFPYISYLVGEPVEIINENHKFDKAEIIFQLNADILKNNNINDLTIGCYDMDKNELNPIETTVNEKEGSLYAEVKKFNNQLSFYFIMNKKQWMDELAITSETREFSNKLVDIVFLFDTTGSTRDSINDLKDNAEKLANDLARNKLDSRLGIVSFKDIDSKEEKDFSKNYGWYTKIELFKKQIAALKNGGGLGDGPESAVDGLETARRMYFRRNAVKLIVLLTDAAYKENTNYADVQSMKEEIELLKQDNIQVIVLSKDKLKGTYKDLYTKTNGDFLSLDQNMNQIITSCIRKINKLSDLYRWIRLSNGTVAKLINKNLNEGADSDRDGMTDKKELENKITQKFGQFEYDAWRFKTNPGYWDYVMNGKILNSADIYGKDYPYYSEEEEDIHRDPLNGVAYKEARKSVRTFSVNQMYTGIRKIYFSTIKLHYENSKTKINENYLNANVMYFLQKSKYSNIMWKGLGFDIAELPLFNQTGLYYNIQKDLDKIKEYKQYKNAKLKDPLGHVLDFTHMMASCNSMYGFRGDPMKGIPIELSGWGGDLQTLLADLVVDCEFRSNETEINASIKKLLGTNSSRSSFGSEDMYADIDAVNLQYVMKTKYGNLFRAFQYYYGKDSIKKRFTKFYNYYGEKKLKERISLALPLKSFHSYSTLYNHKYLTDLKVVFINKAILIDHKKIRWPSQIHVKALQQAFFNYIKSRYAKE